MAMGQVDGRDPYRLNEPICDPTGLSGWCADSYPHSVKLVTARKEKKISTVRMSDDGNLGCRYWGASAQIVRSKFLEYWAALGNGSENYMCVTDDDSRSVNGPVGVGARI